MPSAARGVPRRSFGMKVLEGYAGLGLIQTRPDGVDVAVYGVGEAPEGFRLAGGAEEPGVPHLSREGRAR